MDTVIIYWVLAIVLYVIITFNIIIYLYSRIGKFQHSHNELIEAKSEVRRLKSQLENEKIARKMDATTHKIQSHFEEVLSEVNSEAKVAMDFMASHVESVQSVKKSNVSTANEENVSSNMQFKSKLKTSVLEKLGVSNG